MINKSKSCFFEKINKINKRLPNSSKKQTEVPKNKIRNERQEVKADTTEIKGL